MINDRVLIMAEAGVNHNGSIVLAKQLADTAKKCGADIIKFQTFHVNKLASKYAQMADYQKENTGIEETQQSMLKCLALTEEEFRELATHCRYIGIRFLSTPFDIDSIHFLNELQDIWKIPSGEITNYPYLVEIAKTGKDIILSTGMSSMEEITDAMEVLKKHGAGEIKLLHCTTEYPTPFRDVNLRAMQSIKDRFQCVVGYSDHTPGIEVAIAAVAMGASIIEKHFTLDKNMEGPDHKASLEPKELTTLITSIRNIEDSFGNGVKTPTLGEKKNMLVVRKSIIAKRDISKGEVLSEENITTKRPGNGINPMRWNEVIGTRAIRDFKEDELIEI